MKVSELMQAMSDAGAPMAAIVIAVQAVEAAQAEAAQALQLIKDQRAAARDKKRRQRNTSRDNMDDVPGLSRDASGTNDVSGALSLPPNENNSNPPPIPTQDITPVREEPIFHIEAWRDFHAKRLGKFKVPRRMPDEWEPVLTENAQRMVDGWPPGDGETPGMFEQQLAAFRDHAADKGRTSKDWQAAFRTWITNANRWKPNARHENRAGAVGKSDEPRNPYVRAAINRQAERAAVVGGSARDWS